MGKNRVCLPISVVQGGTVAMVEVQHKGIDQSRKAQIQKVSPALIINIVHPRLLISLIWGGGRGLLACGVQLLKLDVSTCSSDVLTSAD